MIYSDYAAQVRRELEEATAQTYADESILAWTNEGILDLAKRGETQEEQTYCQSVIGQQSYDLPDYTLEIRKLAYNDYDLTRVPIENWYEMTQSGTPAQWDIMNRAIMLYPIPTVAATLTIFRRRSPTPIASVTATTPMPFESRHDATIKNYVKAQAMAQVSDLQSFNAYIQAYERAIVDAWQQERNEESTGIPREVW